MTERSEPIRYGRHDITNRKSVDGWQARAFRGRLPTSQVHTAGTRDAAVEAVKAEIIERERAEQARRGPDGYPTAEEVARALALVSMSKQQETMLLAHFNAPDQTLTATELAASAGYPNYSTANSIYGKLGRMLAEEMDWVPPARSDGTPVWTLALATDAEEASGEPEERDSPHWRWRMRPEVSEAIHQERLER